MDFWSWLWGDALDPEVNLKALELISLMGSINPNPAGRFQRWVADNQGTQFTYRGKFVDDTPTFTRTLAVQVSSQGVLHFTLLISLGTRGTMHVSNLIAGWSDMATSGPTGASGGFQTAANDLILAIGPEWFDTEGQTFYYLGHSYGGAQLQALASNVKRAAAPRYQRIFSYGAPRVGTSSFQLATVGTSHVRYFNDDDPVRLIPPHLSEAPILHSVLPGSLSRGASSQVQAEQGYALHNGGGVTITETWPSRLAISELGLIGWLTSNSGFASNLHSIEEYQARFWAAQVRRPQPEPAPDGAPEEELPEYYTNSTFQQITMAAVRQIDTAIFPASDATIPTVVQSGLYRARKLPVAGWCVARDGEVIVRCNGKRIARRLARQYNRTVREKAALTS